MDEFSGNRAMPRVGATVFALVILIACPGPTIAAGTEAKPPAAAAPEPAKPSPPPAPAPPKVVKVKPPPVEPRLPRMLSDVHTGLALGGHDPVAYFVEGEARPGKPEFELDWRGAAWRFVNEGNMEIFKGSPDVYAPRFVGHDPFQVARGFLAEGSPYVSLVLADRLYLFATPANRVAFLLNAEEEIAAADKAWPNLARELP